jgi:hypothetical protein
MSAINVIRQRDRVVLFTDGAVWDGNAGIVVGFPNQGGGNPILGQTCSRPGATLCACLKRLCRTATPIRQIVCSEACVSSRQMDDFALFWPLSL